VGGLLAARAGSTTFSENCASERRFVRALVHRFVYRISRILLYRWEGLYTIVARHVFEKMHHDVAMMPILRTFMVALGTVTGHRTPSLFS
jgi:hypothetical protein